ncbi:MAG: glycosyltransferase [Deltaproteobacteria bacterium]|nr:glycosyltransferase [Deltaproteobacteria bacterium]
MKSTKTHLFPSFAVLLAAYNGAEWIEKQLKSILEQEKVDVTVFISLDISSDNTLQLIRECTEKNKSVILLPSIDRFGGAAKNFYRLFRDVELESYDYIALSDQDDIWLKEKLIAAHRCIDDGGYSAYSSNAIAFWPNGRETIINKSQPQRRYDYLFEAAGPGCTYVLSVDTALKFKKYLTKNWASVNDVALHDWMIYAWVRSNSMSWFIDNVPYIKYRQHATNQVGANQGIKAIISRAKKLNEGWYKKEIKKIWCLVAPNIKEISPSLFDGDRIPLLFLVRNISQMRRRLRDRIILFTLLFLGRY